MSDWINKILHGKSARDKLHDDFVTLVNECRKGGYDDAEIYCMIIGFYENKPMYYLYEYWALLLLDLEELR